MNWDFKRFNNYRAQIREKDSKAKYLMERFSTTSYSRLRVLKVKEYLNLNPLNPPIKELSKKDVNILDRFEEKVEKKSNKKKTKSDFEKVTSDFQKTREMFLQATQGTKEEFEEDFEEEIIGTNEFIFELEEEEEDNQGFFDVIEELEEDTDDTDDFTNLLGKLETVSEENSKETTKSAIEDISEDIVNFALDEEDDSKLKQEEESLKKSILIEDLGPEGSIETDRDENETLMDLLLRYEDQSAEIVGREYVNTTPTFLDEIIMYDKLEKFKTTDDADLIVEYQYGDKPMAAQLVNMVNTLIDVIPSNPTLVKEGMLDENHSVTSQKEISYKEFYGEDKDGNRVKVVEILDLEGLIISKYFETENFEIRLHLDQNIRGFKNRNDILPETPYLKAVKPNPYRVKKNIGQSHKMIQLPPIEYFKSFLNLDYVDNANYWIADTEEKLIKVKEAINSLHPDHIIAYDAETTGLDFHHWLPEEERDVLVTHSFSWEDNQSVIIPIRMKTRRNISPEIFKKHMKEIMETRRFLAHNGPADVRFNMPDGIRLNIVEDTFFLAKHLMPYLQVNEMTGKSQSRSNVTRGLDVLIKRMFRRDLIDMNRYVFRPAGIQFDFSIMNDDYLIYYGCPDTDMLRQLWKIWRRKLEPIQENAYKSTVRAACIMAENATYYGISLDEDIIFGGRARAEETAKHLEEVALKLVGETKDTLQLGSAKQLANFIYGKYGVPVTPETKRTPKGDLSADKEALEELAKIKRDTPSDIFQEDIIGADGEIVRVGKIKLTKDYLNSLKYPFCAIVRAWSDQTSDITANYNRLLNKAKDGVYYPEYRIGATATWRSTEGLQTVKGSLKGGLGTYGDDWYFLSMDFAAEELRLAVNQSNDDAFKDILEHPESDPHTSAGAELFELEQYQVDRGVRGKAKACNFGIIYGMKPYTLSTSMFGTRFPTQEQVDEATDTYNRYVYRFSEMIKALQPARKEVEQNGYLYNNLGFKNIYDDVLDLDDFERQIFDPNDLNPPTVRLDPLRYDQYKGALMNKAGNYPIQSWGAGLLLFLIIAFDKRIRQEGLQDKVKLPVIVHDEVGLIIHESVDPYLMVSIMIDVFELDMSYLERRTVPLFLGIGFGMSWGEAGSDEAEIPVRLQHQIKKEYLEGRSPQGLRAHEVGPHFQERIKEYMRVRLREVLRGQLESGVYKTGEVVDILRNEVFVLNKGNEVFGFYNPAKDSYNHNKIIEVITTNLSYEDSIKWADRELKVVETSPQPPKELDKDNDPVDFFFEPLVHSRIMSFGDTVIVDCTGLRKTVTQNLLKYLMYFNEPNDEKSKQLVMKLGNNNVKVKGYKLKGLPLNAGTVVDEILEGKPAPEKRDGKIIRNTIPLKDVVYFKNTDKDDKLNNILVGVDKNLIINLNPFEIAHRRKVLEDIVKILTPTLTENEGFPVKVKTNNNYQSLGFNVKGLPATIVEKLARVVQIGD